MKKLISLAAALFVVACGAAQDARNSSVIIGSDALLSCSGDDSSFVIRPSAVPSLVQGVLTLGDDSVSLRCVKPEQAPVAGDMESVAWSCEEIRAGGTNEGVLKVQVLQGGVAGLTRAEVSRAQMFPLPAQKLASLICRR